MTKRELEIHDEAFNKGREHERIGNHTCFDGCKIAACVNRDLRSALAEARAENEKLRKVVLVAQEVCDGQLNFGTVVSLREKLAVAEKALSRAQAHLCSGVLQTGQHVKQLDGSVKWELVPTVQSEVLGVVTKALAAVKGE